MTLAPKYPFNTGRFIAGFTLIEILLAIGILAILVISGLPFSLDFYRSQQLDSSAQEIIQTLRRAQLKAVSVENDSNFGVYLTNDNYTLFQGRSFANRVVFYDEVFALPEVITINGIQEIVFLKFEGLPSQTGNVILKNNGEKRIININKIGRVNLEL